MLSVETIAILQQVAAKLEQYLKDLQNMEMPTKRSKTDSTTISQSTEFDSPPNSLSQATQPYNLHTTLDTKLLGNDETDSDSSYVDILYER
jgi:hypothetical protein